MCQRAVFSRKPQTHRHVTGRKFLGGCSTRGGTAPTQGAKRARAHPPPNPSPLGGPSALHPPLGASRQPCASRRLRRAPLAPRPRHGHEQERRKQSRRVPGCESGAPASGYPPPSPPGAGRGAAGALSSSLELRLLEVAHHDDKLVVVNLACTRMQHRTAHRAVSVPKCACAGTPRHRFEVRGDGSGRRRVNRKAGSTRSLPCRRSPLPSLSTSLMMPCICTSVSLRSASA